MKKAGLTGNIGSGKSTVANIFSILGIPIYHADIEAKKFLFQKDVIDVLIDKFGDNIITNKQIDKKKLASIVFNDNNALIYLNNLIHPLVKEDFDNWCNLLVSNPEYIIQEAAILFESNFNQYFDKIILVTAPLSIRLERVSKRDQINKEEIIKRMNNQWDEEKKIKLSDYIIQNDNFHLLIPQVIEIHKKIINDIA